MRLATYRHPGSDLDRVGVVVGDMLHALAGRTRLIDLLGDDEAEARIAGYCVMNDWSARDLQRREMKLSMGPVKGKDFATSLGPILVTPDEIGDRRSGCGYDLAMTARVNGTEYSRALWSD